MQSSEGGRCEGGLQNANGGKKGWSQRSNVDGSTEISKDRSFAVDSRFLKGALGQKSGAKRGGWGRCKVKSEENRRKEGVSKT